MIALGLAAAAVVLAVPVVFDPPAASALETVYACAGGPGSSTGVMVGFSYFGISYANTCEDATPYLVLAHDPVNSEIYGATAGWFAHAPLGLAIERAQVGTIVATAVPSQGYVAQFEWNGNQTCGALCQISFPPGGGAGSFDTGAANTLNSPDFGWVLACAPSNGGGCPSTGTNQALVQVSDVELTVGETPGLVGLTGGSGLWSQRGWVQGAWPLGFSSSSPSGVCQEAATLNGLGLTGAIDVIGSQNQLAWQQCAAPPYSDPSINTKSFGQGPMPLTLTATDAAGETGTQTETVYVDNSSPTVTLSGPTSAPSTAGTQYVTATGGGSLAPIIDIQCSVDDGPTTTYKGATAEVPVSGLGEHVVSCTDQDASVNSAGAYASSTTPATWHVDIAQPTESAVAFSRMIGGLHCKVVRERVKSAGRWVTIRRHGKPVKVRRGAHSKLVKVTKCKPRMVKRKITVEMQVHRHGKTILVRRRKVVRVIAPPRVVSEATRRARYGEGTTVSGWLGTAAGTALAGRNVDVMTAPDDGQAQWRQAAAVTTAADGTWTAHLPGGPSRLVEATYAGDSTTEPATSTPIHLLVPAEVQLKVTPRAVGWGDTVKITGRVLGGYIPTGSKLLRLRIGVEGVKETVGIPSIASNGRFGTTWTFAPGRGVVRYWFSVSTLGESDYPFAPGSSRRVYVTVG